MSDNVETMSGCNNCDPWSENPALPANIAFELEVILHGCSKLFRGHMAKVYILYV